MELKEAHQEIIEIYAGMDDFIAETAPEGYQQRIIKQMKDVSIDVLKWNAIAANANIMLKGRSLHIVPTQNQLILISPNTDIGFTGAGNGAKAFIIRGLNIW